MKLLDLYTSILLAGGMTVDSEGFVSVRGATDTSPVLIEGKRLVLPTQAQLMEGNFSGRIVFHPLSENVLRGESEIITKMRNVFKIRMIWTLATIGQSLLQICASYGEHHKLNPDQSQLLLAVKEVDDKTMVVYQQLMMAAIEDTENSFLSLYLKRKCVINGKIWARGGVVTFPLYEELKKDQEKYYGVKLRAKDRTAIMQLLEYILPGLDVPETYNVGSDSPTAPFLDALMRTVMGVASRMNDVLELFGEMIDNGDQLVFNSDWVTAFENLEVMLPQIRMIPMQAGNEGRSKAGEPAASTAVATQPMTYVTPVQPAVVAALPYNGGGYGQPQQFPFPVQQQQPAAVVETANGRQWDSFMRSNPSIAANAMAGNALTRGPQGNYVVQEEPRWARREAPVNAGGYGGYNNGPGYGGANNFGSGAV